MFSKPNQVFQLFQNYLPSTSNSKKLLPIKVSNFQIDSTAFLNLQKIILFSKTNLTIKKGKEKKKKNYLKLS